MNTEPAHAKLSASGSDKWMTCTPSARLEEDFQDESSDFAREGTFAHAVFEQDLLATLAARWNRCHLSWRTLTRLIFVST